MVANQLPFFAVALVSKARLGHGKHTDLCSLMNLAKESSGKTSRMAR
jgi:hypothetical protein